MKKWLIRTKSHHILGPLNKAKIRELIESKSLDDEDEICQANGYWFHLSEKELVQKYIFDEEIQSFNPVSEAQSVLVETENKDTESSIESTADTIVENDLVIESNSSFSEVEVDLTLEDEQLEPDPLESQNQDLEHNISTEDSSSQNQKKNN